MYSQLRDYIRSRIMIPDNELEKAFHYSSTRHFRKGDIILKTGEYCRFIAFINYGLVTGVVIDENGKEIATNFTFENCFFTYTEGISNNAPSHKDFLALEDCEMLMVEKEKLPLIFSINPKFETLFTKILAEELSHVLLVEQFNKTQPAENRYLNFIERCPQAFNRIPLKYIAGYLGIEPQSLSRLRKKLASR
ncbi:MAG TPA: Crp/Fnr family transcriptional regulator [Chitinophagaceae bacterium]